MFIHHKTKVEYHSIREEINRCKKELKSKKTELEKFSIQKHINELQALNERSYSEPALIVTDDSHFGNEPKPRLCVVIDEDKNDRVYVAPIIHRKTKAIILDNDYDRQIGDRRKWINRSEIYENKHITDVKPLTDNDKAKIKKILRKK